MLFVNSLYLDLVLTVAFMCVFIPLWVFMVLGWNLVENGAASVEDESNFIEFAWTFIPTLAVLFLCNLNIQCIGLDFVPKFSPVVKVTGHQWYWSYETVGFDSEYDSVMLDFTDSVDKPLRLFLDSQYSFAVTSADVIHSFSVPDFNLKMDAVPGRINQVRFSPDRLGVFVGYCTELCGAGHGYMPVVVEVVNRPEGVSGSLI